MTWAWISTISEKPPLGLYTRPEMVSMPFRPSAFCTDSTDLHSRRGDACVAPTNVIWVAAFPRIRPTTHQIRPPIYKLVRAIGQRVGVTTRPHGLRHTAISEAVRLVQQNGMDVTAVLKFSRHTNMSTLQYYLDQESPTQGKIADLVATASE
jgi:integrase